VAAAAAAVAAAAAATGTAQQTLVAMNRQASVAAAAAVVAAAKAKSDSDVDLMEVASAGKQHHSPKASQGSSTSGGTPVQPSFKLNDVCQPGNTLLWDLLQDDKIVSYLFYLLILMINYDVNHKFFMIISSRRDNWANL